MNVYDCEMNYSIYNTWLSTTWLPWGLTVLAAVARRSSNSRQLQNRLQHCLASSISIPLAPNPQFYHYNDLANIVFVVQCPSLTLIGENRPSLQSKIGKLCAGILCVWEPIAAICMLPRPCAYLLLKHIETYFGDKNLPHQQKGNITYVS